MGGAGNFLWASGDFPKERWVLAFAPEVPARVRENGMSLRKAVGLTIGSGLIWAALAGPAWAHVEVEAEPGQPGAVDALVKIMAEAESTTAGISKVEVVADPAIPADQVTIADGPSGWKAAAGPLGGFVLEGPALPTGEDAKVSLRVKTLPDAPQVVFKVIETYSDGKISRWISLPGPDGKEPDNPAPIIKLTAGAASAVSPKPAGNDDDDKGQAALATTGAADGALSAVGGLLLALGGFSIVVGTGSRPRVRRV